MRFISKASLLAPWHCRRSAENLPRLGVLLAVLAIAGTAFVLHEKVRLEHAGYAGLALTAVLASGGLVLPIPALATACAAGVLLNPLYVGLVAGTAETLGELTGYFLGYSGRGVLDQGRLYQRLEGWMRRRGWLLLFLVSLVPNPVFDVVGIAAGALRFPLWRFLGVVWTGKVLKFLVIAYACAYSVEWLTGLFGL